MGSTKEPSIRIPSDSLASLTDLPHELLLQVIDELDGPALCALGSTCKDLNDLIFPLFFDKHNITSPLQGWISCYRAPEHTLRAIRCSLATKNISNIHYYFNKGINGLVEEVEEMHAIVRRADEVTDFKVYLHDPDDWALRDAPSLNGAQVPRLTSEEWTKLYLGLLTTSLTKGCKCVQLSGGDLFLKYLRDRDRTTVESGLAGPVILRQQNTDDKATRYFDGSFRYISPFVGEPSLNPQTAQIHAVEKLPENILHDLDGKPGNIPAPIVKDQRKRSRLRLTKWIEFFFKRDNNGAHVKATISSSTSRNSRGPSFGLDRAHIKDLRSPSSQANTLAPSRAMDFPLAKLERLFLHSDMLFASPSFLDWTTQLLFWCAPTLTQLELQCPKTSSGIWCKFFSDVRLPSLTRFETTVRLVVDEAHIQGSDILGFLSRHPSIRNLSLHGIQVPTCLCDLPKYGNPILPNLTEVKAHPIYIRWLLRDKKQCPKLKIVLLQTEYYTSMNRTFPYDGLDRALEDLLPRSQKLDVIGFRFTNDHYPLDSWLQLHVDAGPNASILSKFVNTKHLLINSAYYVSMINRIELVAQFVGLLPNLDYLELQEQPDTPYGRTDHIPPVVEALRQHSPRVKQLEINNNSMIDVDKFEI